MSLSVDGRVGRADSWLTSRRIGWALAGVVALIAVLLAVRVTQHLAADRSVTNKGAIPSVTVTAAGLSTQPSTVSIIGTISARFDTPIGVEGDGGRVSAILVEAGDHVHRGQVLARIDTSVLEPQVANLQASLELARAESELAAAEYHRAQAVGAAGALSAEETEKRRSNSVTAAAKVKVAAAQLAEAQAKLARAEVRAPGEGTLLTRTVEVGQTVAPGATLFRLAEGNEVELRGEVAEQDLSAAQGRSGRQRPAHRHLDRVSGPRTPARGGHRSSDPLGGGAGVPDPGPQPASGRIRPRRGHGEQRAADRAAADGGADG